LGGKRGRVEGASQRSTIQRKRQWDRMKKGSVRGKYKDHATNPDITISEPVSTRGERNGEKSGKQEIKKNKIAGERRQSL